MRSYYYNVFHIVFQLKNKSTSSPLIILSTESLFQPNPPWNAPHFYCHKFQIAASRSWPKRLVIAR